MNVKTLPVGQMRANCHIAWSSKGEAIVIDPGDDADLIINTLQDNDLTPLAIVATHGHFDHIMAVLELKLAFNIPFYINSDDEFLLKRMEQTALYFAGIDPGPPPDYEVELAPNATISISDLNFEVISTPGHTPGSVSLYFREEKALFVGDVVFKGGLIGRTDFKYADKQSLIKSVQTILSLPEETIVYTGHDDPTNISELKRVLEFA